IPTEVNSPAFGSVLSSDFMRWLVMPISPRRYQPPKSAGGGGGYIGGAAIGRSAANAPVDIKETAPAAMRDFTLRIWLSSFWPVRRNNGKPHIQKSTCGRCHQKLKRRLTLIFKVDAL